MQVSFGADDVIINVTPRDHVWMTGTVKSTGQTGLLPCSFIEFQGYLPEAQQCIMTCLALKVSPFAVSTVQQKQI